MKIQINTDNNIKASEELVERFSNDVASALENVSRHVTRVEVHLSDENAGKGGPHDQRCMMEARLEGRQPIAVTDEAATLDSALHGACHKLVRMISDIVDAKRDRNRRPDHRDGDVSAHSED
mgnify:CR=1 FL=1